MGQVPVDIILMEKVIFIHYGLDFRKRPPPISDHLGVKLWVGRLRREVKFDCIISVLRTVFKMPI